MNIVDGPGFSGARCDVWKVSVVQHLLDLRFTHALTLAWNRKLTLDSAKAKLTAMFGDVRLCANAAEPGCKAIIAVNEARRAAQ